MMSGVCFRCNDFTGMKVLFSSLLFKADFWINGISSEFVRNVKFWFVYDLLY